MTGLETTITLPDLGHPDANCSLARIVCTKRAGTLEAVSFSHVGQASLRAPTTPTNLQQAAFMIAIVGAAMAILAMIH